ncbi:MAG: inositol monophosphatase family protein, partial [Bryobacteraceae bacterium]|nr:inositol monophosphatase family protein [Bryobacteraceae bacterium]
ADGHLWLVDPNDATGAFLQGLRGPSVSIALLRHGTPVLGVVFAYTAPDDAGDLIFWAEGLPAIERNGHRLSRHWPHSPSKAAVVLTSVKRTAADVRHSQALAHPMTVRQTPSIAYRLALVAAGEADLTVSSTHLKSWDYAAGHALVNAAGGLLRGASGMEITYSEEGTSETGGKLFGGSPELVTEAARRWK